MEKVIAPKSVTSYIGLGSNLGDRAQALQRALEKLGQMPHTKVLRVSEFEETTPIGPIQPLFLNAVAAIKTSLPALELLDVLQAIENHLGRIRSEPWGPRIIDLDILYYGNETINHPRLTVPHPQIPQRYFVQRELRQAGYRG